MSTKKNHIRKMHNTSLCGATYMGTSFVTSAEADCLSCMRIHFFGKSMRLKAPKKDQEILAHQKTLIRAAGSGERGIFKCDVCGLYYRNKRDDRIGELYVRRCRLHKYGEQR